MNEKIEELKKELEFLELEDRLEMVVAAGDCCCVNGSCGGGGGGETPAQPR